MTNSAGHPTFLGMVTTRAVVWIEMVEESELENEDKQVTTRAVVWIEIAKRPGTIQKTCRSPPVRWCGLKSGTRPDPSGIDRSHHPHIGVP